MHFRNIVRLFCATGTVLGAFYQSPAIAATYTTFDPRGSVRTKAYGINPEGDVAGLYFDALGQHGFFLRNGAFTTFDVPGSFALTQGVGINAAGVVVGDYFDSGLVSHGYVRTPERADP